MQHLLQMLRGASPVPFYLLVGASAAVQNIVPLPIADLAVLFAAFLMTAGHSTVFGVFLAAWLGNAGLACLFFVLARRYGAGNPNARLVRWVPACGLRRQGPGAGRTFVGPGTDARLGVGRSSPVFASIAYTRTSSPFWFPTSSQRPVGSMTKLRGHRMPSRWCPTGVRRPVCASMAKMAMLSKSPRLEA